MTLALDFKTGERINLDLTTLPPACAACRRELGPGEQRLDLRMRVNGAEVDVTICRSCLSEHSPLALAAIEE